MPRTKKTRSRRRQPKKALLRAPAASRKARTGARDLRTLLAALGLSQRKFSASLGVDESYVSHVLRGSKDPSFRLATRWADALGISLGDFRVLLERSVEGGEGQ